jgi:RHS repeat-associated protein
MNNHPNATPASPSLASPLFDASFDSIESLTTTFAASVVPTIETTTVTEVALGYHRNQQYSITAMTTSTGAVAERYAYTAYGQPTILDASGSQIGNQQSQIANRFTYNGREWDEPLGLHHFRAKWMSPIAGRFLGRDPISHPTSDGFFRVFVLTLANRYQFVHGQSLNFLDPAGLVIFGYDGGDDKEDNCLDEMTEEAPWLRSLLELKLRKTPEDAIVKCREAATNGPCCKNGRQLPHHLCAPNGPWLKPVVKSTCEKLREASNNPKQPQLQPKRPL